MSENGPDYDDPIDHLDPGDGTTFADWVRVCGHSGFNMSDIPAMELIRFTQASLILHEGPGWPWAANTYRAYQDFIKFSCAPQEASPVRRIWGAYDNWAGFGSSLVGMANVTNTSQDREWAEEEVARFKVRRDLLVQIACKDYQLRQASDPIAAGLRRISNELSAEFHQLRAAIHGIHLPSGD